MELIFFIVLTAPIWTGLIFSLRVGLRAWRFEPEYPVTKAALRWIVLNLCEPFVNFILIGLMTIVDPPQLDADFNAWPIMLRMLPMLVLLLPAIDLRAENPIQRSIATQALKYGFARWIVTIAIHASISSRQWNPASFFCFLVIGTVLLWISAFWGRGHLRAIIRNESYAMLEARA